MLYPLSYEGGGCAVVCAKLADEPRTGDFEPIGGHVRAVSESASGWLPPLMAAGTPVGRPV